ncbi:hypothetical protein L6R53_00760 [Myxococcota bacterium]|nr:hypothetical protein [Myxococcota bacterium]
MTHDPFSLDSTSAPRGADRAQLLQVGAAAALLLAIAGVGVAAITSEDAPTPQDIVVIGVDASLTSTPGSRCEDVQRLAIDAVDRATGTLRLTLRASGDATTGMQSTLVGTATLDRGAGLVDVDHDGPRQAFLAAVRDLCATIPTRGESPLLELALASLQDAATPPGAGPEVSVRVYLRTDGIEEVDPILTAAIHQQAGWNTRQAKAALPEGERKARLELGAATLELCGLSSRSTKPGKLPAPGLAQIEAAWRPEASDQDRLHFAASCASRVASDRVAASLAAAPAPASPADGSPP